jgi:hypothetical protein
MVGDVNGARTLLHEAVDEGCLAGANAAHFPHVQSITRRVPLVIAFTHPQIALLGARFRDLSPAPITIGHSSYAGQGRARVQAEGQGEVRVYVDRASQHLLGRELYGPDAEHTAHLLAWMVQAKLPQHRDLDPFQKPERSTVASVAPFTMYSVLLSALTACTLALTGNISSIVPVAELNTALPVVASLPFGVTTTTDAEVWYLSMLMSFPSIR